MRLFLPAALAAGVSTMAMAQAVDAGKVIDLQAWDYEELYTGMSVDDFLDEYEVVDQNGEEIGDVEDVIIGGSGQVLSVVAEVGGFWDIGDRHVSVPWDEVVIENDTVILPLTEENVESYDYFTYSGLAGSDLDEEVVRGVDDLDAGARAWRASELIGDYARLHGEDGEVEYGYVSDMIIRDGSIAATVVEPNIGFSTGYYAYPYYGYGYGYGYGWEPGAAYYDMPYTADQVAGREPFEYERFE